MDNPAIGNKDHFSKLSLIFGLMLCPCIRNKYIRAFLSGPQAPTCNSIWGYTAVLLAWRSWLYSKAKAGLTTVPAWAHFQSIHEGLHLQTPIDPTYTDQRKGACGRILSQRWPKACDKILQFLNFLLHRLLFFQKIPKILTIFIWADLVLLSAPIQGRKKLFCVCRQTPCQGSGSCSVTVILSKLLKFFEPQVCHLWERKWHFQDRVVVMIPSHVEQALGI